MLFRLGSQQVVMRALCMTSAFLITSTGVFAEECQAILEQGIRNTFQSLRAGNLKSSFRNGFCDKSLQQMKDGRGGGLSLGFPIDGVPINLSGNYSDSSAKTLQREICSNSSGDLSDAKYESLMQAIADPTIVNAWTQCKSNSGGVLLNGKLNGSTLILSMRFRNIGSVSETKLTGDAMFDGAICPKLWVDGLRLDGSEKYMQCKRIGTDPITVTVNTSFNGAMFYIPPPPQLTMAANENRTPSSSPGSPEVIPPFYAKVCINPTNNANRCPANDQAAVGSQCACNPPTSFTVFNDGTVQSILISNVTRAPGMIPAPADGR